MSLFAPFTPKSGIAGIDNNFVEDEYSSSGSADSEILLYCMEKIPPLS